MGDSFEGIFDLVKTPFWREDGRLARMNQSDSQVIGTQRHHPRIVSSRHNDLDESRVRQQ